MKNIILFILILTTSCERIINMQNKTVDFTKTEQVEIPTHVQNLVNEVSFQTPVLNWDNYDWITEYDWNLDGGDWIGDLTPFVNIYKLDIPQESDLYQIRLRDEHFYFYYHNKDINVFYPLKNTFFNSIQILEIVNNYSKLKITRDDKFYTFQDRQGEQVNFDYPLIGIWGRLPFLTEYRLIDHKECLYYMEIDKNIPGWAIREGTYLLKQTGDFEFETISSFPDGKLHLKVLNEEMFLITPLFTHSDVENGNISPIAMRRIPFKVDKEIDQ